MQGNHMSVTDQELRDLVAQLARSHAETERVLQQTAEQLRLSKEETDRALQQTAEQLRLSKQENDRETRELRKQIGGLGEKFGSFTEGMAWPSMKKLLIERLGATFVTNYSLRRKQGESMELDVLAYTNSDKNTAYVVEVKSHLREEGLQQLLKTLNKFSEFFPEHRDKKLYGVLAAVTVPEDLAAKVLAQGIYLARISGDTFELDVPQDFQPRSFQ